MKTRMLIFMSIFLLAVIFLFAEDVKKEISEKEVLKTLSGIQDVVSRRFYYKTFIRYPDGSYKSERSEHIEDRIISIEERRIDSNGDIWYKAIYEKVPKYELGKPSDLGNKWEYASDYTEFPTTVLAFFLSGSIIGSTQSPAAIYKA